MSLKNTSRAIHWVPPQGFFENFDEFVSMNISKFLLWTDPLSCKMNLPLNINQPVGKAQDKTITSMRFYEIFSEQSKLKFQSIIWSL